MSINKLFVYLNQALCIEVSNSCFFYIITLWLFCWNEWTKRGKTALWWKKVLSSCCRVSHFTLRNSLILKAQFSPYSGARYDASLCVFVTHSPLPEHHPKVPGSNKNRPRTRALTPPLVSSALEKNTDLSDPDYDKTHKSKGTNWRTKGRSE